MLTGKLASTRVAYSRESGRTNSQPITYELVINMQSANAIGVDIPATVHVRSNEVIE
jgi:hypothetical protein